MAVKETAAHARAQIARVFLGAAGDGEDIRLKNLERHLEVRGVFLEFFPVFGCVAGVHREVTKGERHVAVLLQGAQQKRQKH